MPRPMTNTMMQMLAEKEIGRQGNISDILLEEATAIRTALGTSVVEPKVSLDHALINFGDYSVGLEIRRHATVASGDNREQHYVITATGLTKHGEPLPDVTEALQRLGYTLRESTPVHLDALRLL